MVDSDKLSTVTVLSVTAWTTNLFSFTVSRPQHFRFVAGQFVRLGLTKTLATGESEAIFRAYSVVSSPYDEVLEFFSIVVPNGAFTSELKNLKVGDTLLLDNIPYGFLTLARFQHPPPKDLWLLATGTGVAPFLSMLQDFAIWQTYQHIVLAYSVRYVDELAYGEKINSLAATFAGEGGAKLHFVPIVTRESNCINQPELVKHHSDNPVILNQRLPMLLQQELLQQQVGLTLNTDSSHIMLCGNPQMVEDTKETLKQMGLVMNRRGEGNIAVENYW